jgi:hypothetical protein
MVMTFLNYSVWMGQKFRKKYADKVIVQHHYYASNLVSKYATAKALLQQRAWLARSSRRYSQIECEFRIAGVHLPHRRRDALVTARPSLFPEAVALLVASRAELLSIDRRQNVHKILQRFSAICCGFQRASHPNNVLRLYLSNRWQNFTPKESARQPNYLQYQPKKAKSPNLRFAIQLEYQLPTPQFHNEKDR